MDSVTAQARLKALAGKVSAAQSEVASCATSRELVNAAVLAAEAIEGLAELMDETWGAEPFHGHAPIRVNALLAHARSRVTTALAAAPERNAAKESLEMALGIVEWGIGALEGSLRT